MTFNSLHYAVFLPIVLVVYWHLKHRAQNVFLLVASYVFYGSWDYRFLGLIVLSTLIDYFASLGLGKTQRAGRRRLLLAISMIGNLGILGTFKYYGFFGVGCFAARGDGFGTQPFSIGGHTPCRNLLLHLSNSVLHDRRVPGEPVA